MLHYEQTVSTTCQLVELGAAMNYAIMNKCEGFGVDYFSSLGYVKVAEVSGSYELHV